MRTFFLYRAEIKESKTEEVKKGLWIEAPDLHRADTIAKEWFHTQTFKGAMGVYLYVDPEPFIAQQHSYYPHEEPLG